MKKFIVGMLLGALLAGGGIWYYQDKEKEEANGTLPERLDSMASDAMESMGDTAREWGERLGQMVKEYDLTPERLKTELAATGRIVREKAADLAGPKNDATTDSEATKRLKALFAKDPELSESKISVEIEDGQVSLSGTVTNAEELSRALALAMETEGVKKISSNLKIRGE